MSIGSLSAVSILAVGWLATATRGADGVIVACLLLSWLLTRVSMKWSSLVGMTMLLTTLAVGAGPLGAAIMGGLALTRLIAIGISRPREAVEWALLAGAVVLGAFAIAGIILEKGAFPQVALALIPLWIMIVDLQQRPFPAGLRWGTLPVFPLIVVLVVSAATGRGISGRERELERMKRACAGDPPNEQIQRLREYLFADPWVPSLWTRLGWLYHDQGRFAEAYDTFRKGYSVRPREANPNTQGLALTAVGLGKWREYAELRVAGYEVIGPSTSSAAKHVAVELWRQGRDDLARSAIQPWESSDPDAQELAGWLTQDVGEDSVALGLLLPLAADSFSGETMWRAAKAAESLGLERIRDGILQAGVRSFPRHLDLAETAGIPPPELPVRKIDQGVLLGNTVKLIGWDCEPDPASPGDTLTVTIAWVPTKPLPPMQVILHLDLGAPPRWRVNADFWPDGRRNATAEWPVGELASAVTRVVLPPDAPTGRYTLYTGLWIPGDRDSRLLPGPEDAHRVPRGEHRFPLGDINVRTPGK